MALTQDRIGLQRWTLFNKGRGNRSLCAVFVFTGTSMRSGTLKTSQTPWKLLRKKFSSQTGGSYLVFGCCPAVSLGTFLTMRHCSEALQYGSSPCGQMVWQHTQPAPCVVVKGLFRKVGSKSACLKSTAWLSPSKERPEAA